MSKDGMPPVAELIAQTPGAQRRDEALSRLQRRRLKRTSENTDPGREAEIGKPEPIPILHEPDTFAAQFFERLKAKEKPKPPKKSKPKLIVDNQKPEPPEK